jgi:hypothetical protein
MRAFLSAAVIAIVLAACAWLVLAGAQKPAYEAFTTSGARLADPGNNLVGKNWFGPQGG